MLSQNHFALSKSVKIVTDMTISKGKPQNSNTLAQQQEHARLLHVSVLYRYAIETLLRVPKFRLAWGHDTSNREANKTAEDSFAMFLNA